MWYLTEVRNDRYYLVPRWWHPLFWWEVYLLMRSCDYGRLASTYWTLNTVLDFLLVK